MGFRDSQGRLTDKAKELIKSGRFSHKNGHIYQTYRIARTEVMRMNAFSTYEQFLETKKQYPNARLKLIAHIDNRTRPQSINMNGQISTATGLFLYPDGKYYRLGTAPAQWCINDRETQTIVFLDNIKEQSQEFSNFNDIWAEADKLAKNALANRKTPELAVKYARNNLSGNIRNRYFNIAKLTDEQKTLLGAKSSDLRISVDSLIKNRIKHPEITAKDYLKVPEILKTPDIKPYKGNIANSLVFEKKIENNNAFLVIKSTLNKEENYFTSLYIGNHNKKQ